MPCINNAHDYRTGIAPPADAHSFAAAIERDFSRRGGSGAAWRGDACVAPCQPPARSCAWPPSHSSYLYVSLCLARATQASPLRVHTTPTLRGRVFWRAAAHRVGAGAVRCGGGTLASPRVGQPHALRLAMQGNSPLPRRAPVGYCHAEPLHSAWPGRHKRPPSASTPTPPLRACPVRIGSSSGLSRNLPLRGQAPPW